jgi:hypothetical protein
MSLWFLDWYVNEIGFECEQLFSVFFYLIQFYSSHGIHRTRMHTYEHTTFAVLDRYDILHGEHKSDAGVDF